MEQDMPMDANVMGVVIVTDQGELMMVVEQGTLTLGEVFGKLEELKGGSYEQVAARQAEIDEWETRYAS